LDSTQDLNLKNVCIKYLSSPDNVLEIIKTIYPNGTDKSSKNRLNRISNALKKIQEVNASFDWDENQTF